MIVNASLKKAIPIVIASAAIYGLWSRQGDRFSGGLLPGLPSWGSPLSRDQHDAKVERASDELKRAERMVSNARDMLGKARGLAQHRFWNERIDEFMDVAERKRDAHRVASEAKDDFLSQQALQELERQDAEERRAQSKQPSEESAKGGRLKK